MAGTGDYDGDGRADMLWLNQSQGWLIYWRIVGTSVVDQRTVIQGQDPAWRIIGNGNYNGVEMVNGVATRRSDVLWYRKDSGGQTYMYLMNGASIVNSQAIYVVGDSSWETVHTP